MSAYKAEAAARAHEFVSLEKTPMSLLFSNCAPGYEVYELAAGNDEEQGAHGLP